MLHILRESLALLIPLFGQCQEFFVVVYTPQNTDYIDLFIVNSISIHVIDHPSIHILTKH